MIRSTFLPFSQPSINNDDINGVVEVLRSGWITTGAKAAQLERNFCDHLGCRGAVALSSATAGMHLALTALGIGPGDEVITPSMTWVSTVNLITLSGAMPVFADVDRHTLMVSADTVEQLITPRTRLIIPVHFAGAPVDMEPVRCLGRQKNIGLIEDSAHALGTEYSGEPIGKTGTSIFSFHPIKNITTAEGGMFCSDDVQLLENIRQLKFHGLGVDAYDRRTQSRLPQAQVLQPGYKYNMTDVSAALGLSQFARLEQLNQKRATLATYYRQRLAEIEEIMPLAVATCPHRHAWHLFIVRLDIDRVPITRDEFMILLKQKRIGTGLHFRAVHRQRYYRDKLKAHRPVLPNTEWNSDRICSLPLFPDMTSEDVDDVVNAIKEILWTQSRASHRQPDPTAANTPSPSAPPERRTAPAYL